MGCTFGVIFNLKSILGICCNDTNIYLVSLLISNFHNVIDLGKIGEFSLFVCGGLERKNWRIFLCLLVVGYGLRGFMDLGFRL